MGVLLAASGREGRANFGNLERAALLELLKLGDPPLELRAGVVGSLTAELRQQLGLRVLVVRDRVAFGIVRDKRRSA